MRPSILAPTFIAVLLFSLSWHGPVQAEEAADAETEPVEHTLPDDPEAAVIVYDSKGGFTARPQNNEPHLTIRADGTVILGARFGQRKRIETTIDEARLQALLRFILDEQKLGEFDEAAVKKQIQKLQRQRGNMMMVADAATTVVRVRADGKTTEASFYALRMTRRQFPEIEALARLAAVEQRLNALRYEIYAGGAEALADYLAQANDSVADAAENDVPPLTLEHLQYVQQLKDGTRQMAFSRLEDLDDNTRRQTSVRITHAPDGKPVFETHVRELPKR